jgi:peptide/nickel transport system substrate-binding protein
VREGRAVTLAGVQVLSELELRVALDAPLDLPRALAAAPAAIVSRSGAGAGPFRPGGRIEGALRLPVFDDHASGRAYADALVLAGLDARRAARAFSRGEADLALRPEAVPGGAVSELPALGASYALVNPRRPGSMTAALKRHLAGLDRAELTRLFVRGPAVPLFGPLPSAILPAAAEARGRPVGPAGAPPRHRLSLLVSSGAESHRAVADRIQVKLFDRGVRVVVQAVDPGTFAARLASGDWDLALVAVTFVTASPSLAALQLAQALGGAPLARQALARLDSADPAAVAAEVAEAAQAVPLFASGLRASIRPGLEGFAPRPDGTLDPGGLWRREGPSR